MNIDIEHLKDCIRYCSKTGVLTWKERPESHFKRHRAYLTWHKRFSGKEAGASYQASGNTRYINVSLGGHRIKGHIVAWCLHYGVKPNGCIDHVNGIGTDNRIENLRDVNVKLNQRNCFMSRSNTSGFTGVCWSKGKNKYKAFIGCSKSPGFHIGYFDSISDAVAARIAAEQKLMYTERHGKELPKQ